MLAWWGRPPEWCVETGTMYGGTTRILAELFRHVVTIEASDFFATEALRRLAVYPNVTVIPGTSKAMLKLHAPDAPCTFYLDAHACREYGAYGTGPTGQWSDRLTATGLWGELDYLATRQHPDLVIVDDLHCFGRGADGCFPFWAEVTREAILGRIGGTGRDFGDQFVVRRSIEDG